jgi:site-specific DNA-adenine methylase
MKAFVTYLKKESPAMQLASGSTGWLELPNGQRWNPDLVNLYKAMAYHTDAFLVELETLFSAGALGEQESRAVFYYAVRDAFNLSGKGGGAESVEAAARFMYLNRHGFNGLCRYNRRGQFNVPFGKYKANYFPLKEVRAFAEKAKRATFITAHYSETLALVRAGDVVYCDPPYLTESGNFTSYTENGFSHLDQGRLARKLRRLSTLHPSRTGTPGVFWPMAWKSRWYAICHGWPSRWPPRSVLRSWEPRNIHHSKDGHCMTGRCFCW